MGGHRQRGGDRVEHHRRRGKQQHRRRRRRRWRHDSIADRLDPRLATTVDGGPEAQFVDLSDLQRSAAHVQGDHIASVDDGTHDADRAAEGTTLEAAVVVLLGRRSIQEEKAAGGYRKR